MIAATILLLCGAAGDPSQTHRAGRGQSDRAAAVSDEILLFDRLHQTFLLLNRVALPAYAEHFSGEPEKLTVVQHYLDRLAAASKGDPEIFDGLVRNGSSDPIGPDSPRERCMSAALEELRNGRVENAERLLGILGAQPHAELRRSEPSATSTAPCPLYDPALLFAHGRLRELKAGNVVLDDGAPAINEQHAVIRSLRERPGDSELSLRKFLDKHRVLLWKLAWSYRCRGVDMDFDSPDAARGCFLRAWAIGDALFPASERGRTERFDPVFLSELGDIYARLERYDLMLRYIYCDEGLPARIELARPIAEMARVAESIRLVRDDGASATQLGDVLPETVSQILFDRSVVAPPEGRAAQLGNSGPARKINAGWVLVAVGGGLVCVTTLWGLLRAARRPHARVSSDS